MPEQPELLGTAGCHLCEQAEGMLAVALGEKGIAWRYTDVTLETGLLEVYGDRIPVLRHAGLTLDWPFGLLDVRRLVAQA